MPGMNGEGFPRKARRRPPKAPLMVLSGYAERDNIRSLNQELAQAIRPPNNANDSGS